MTQARLNHEGIQIVSDLVPDSGWIHADPIQIQQVILNRIRNAAEAMTNQKQPAPIIQIVTSLADPETIRMSVRDEGPGIPEGQRGKLFEAFESTKVDGMGMGLSISRSLIENHNGVLRLDVDYEAGASFDIFLPKLN